MGKPTSSVTVTICFCSNQPEPTSSTCHRADLPCTRSSGRPSWRRFTSISNPYQKAQGPDGPSGRPTVTSNQGWSDLHETRCAVRPPGRFPRPWQPSGFTLKRMLIRGYYHHHHHLPSTSNFGGFTLRKVVFLVLVRRQAGFPGCQGHCDVQ